MKPKTLLRRMAVLVATLMCALGANAQQAYACYTESNKTLTFYYDNQRSSRTGTTYDLNEGDNDTGWDTDGTKSSVTKVVFDPSFADARPTTTYDWFYFMQALQSITGMEYLNTSAVTNMAWMFSACYSLKSLDVSHFNTAKVTNMSGMFAGCYSLKSLDVSSFNTANVENMSSMFYNSNLLMSLDLSTFNTAKVTDMKQMFDECSNLENIYVGDGWSTDAVTNSTKMFYYCSSLEGGQGTTYDANHVDKAYAHIDGGPSNPGYFTAATMREAYVCYTPENTTLTFYYDGKRNSRTGTTYSLNTGTNMPDWYTDGTNASVTKAVFDPSFADARPTTTYGWFYEMKSLQSITGMEYLNTSEVTNMDWMFAFCGKLTSLDVSHFSTSKVTSMNSMFCDCYRLTSLDLSSFNTSKVTNMYQLFNGDSKLQTIYVGSGWSTAKVTESTVVFGSCASLVGGQGTAYNDSNPTDKTYAHIDGGTSNPGYFTEKTPDPEAYACYTPENTTFTFYYDNNRSSRSGTTYSLNTGTYYPGWFNDGTNKNVTKVVFDSSFADARPTITYDWFNQMKSLQSITGMEYLNTSEVINMACMFADCDKLESLDVSHFNTSKVTDMESMFLECNNLTSLDVSHFNTSKVTNMYQMFLNCAALTSLDLSSFNTAKVIYMFSMFRGCTSLTSLDLSSFNTSKVTNMNQMFSGDSKLQTIYVGDEWTTANVTSSESMFSSCNRLVGGQGTTYNDSNPKDKTYAHIDGGTSNPGYFTEKDPEAYACYTPSNTTLTFYYDSKRSSRTGTTYDLNTGETYTGWDTDGTKSKVTQVVFDSSFADARPTTTYDWFYSMTKLQSITGMEFLNTSEVTNMGYMFCSCILLKSIDLSHFDTSKVTSMKSLFATCYLLTSLDLSSFNTSNVTKMGRMFESCNNLQTIYVGDGWSTAAVESSTSMFSNCTSLVGGKGTTYDANHIDAAYAHIDGGSSNLGYFTDAATGLITHIEAVPAKVNTVKGIYTLDGRKLNDLPTQKGIYIIDGNKVVIK